MSSLKRVRRLANCAGHEFSKSVNALLLAKERQPIAYGDEFKRMAYKKMMILLTINRKDPMPYAKSKRGGLDDGW